MQPFSESHFQKISKFIYANYGIFINDDKKDILQTKLIKLMLKNQIKSYEEYYDILTTGVQPKVLSEFLDEITIHKTDFFRENNHFEFLKNDVNYILEKNKFILRNNEIRVWSSACSTGEEAYTLAMVLSESLPQNINIRIMATDISSKVISVAQSGIYPLSINTEVDKYYLSKYFTRVGQNYIVNESLKKLVTFRLFNLTEDFPFKKSLDMVFCRNVMIYFDSKVQQRLLDKFYEVISPGGLLFIGHSESLANKRHGFQYVQPTIYLK